MAQAGDLPAEVVLEELREIHRELQERAENTTKTPLIQDARYEFVEEIARGGAAVVWRVRDRHLQRETAVKYLLDSNDNHDMRGRLEREARLCARLVHPGIVPIHELSQFADKRPFVSMKLVEGKTLLQLLESNPPPPLRTLVEIFTKACQAMAYAHQKDVIHRDLKPGNIMVGSFGEVQIMDWGLAKDLSHPVASDVPSAPPQDAIVALNRVDGCDLHETRRDLRKKETTVVGTVLGTIAYMSPEQASGNIDLTDKRSDVFALGAVLCRIITGAPPYQNGNQELMLRQAQRGELNDALERLARAGQRRLATLAASCMAFDPELRPADASEVACRLASIQKLQQRQKVAIRMVGALTLVTIVLGLSLWVAAKRASLAQSEIKLANQLDPKTFKLVLRVPKPELALNFYREMLEKSPDDTEMYYLVGVALINATRFDEAENVIRQLAVLDIHEPEVPYLLSESLYWQGKFHEAKSAMLESKRRRDVGVRTDLPIESKLDRIQLSIEVAAKSETLTTADYASFDVSKLCDIAHTLHCLGKIENAIEFNNLLLVKVDDEFHRSVLRHQIMTTFARSNLVSDKLSNESREALCRACVVWLGEQFELASRTLKASSQHPPAQQLMGLLIEGTDLGFLKPLLDDKRISSEVRADLRAVLDEIRTSSYANNFLQT